MQVTEMQVTEMTLASSFDVATNGESNMSI
jgi:hypothetical protein